MLNRVPYLLQYLHSSVRMKEKYAVFFTIASFSRLDAQQIQLLHGALFIERFYVETRSVNVRRRIPLMHHHRRRAVIIC
jgi:hypothetical protein